MANQSPTPETTPADTAMRPFSESLPMTLLKAREATMRVFRPILVHHDLTEQQWRVLRALTALEDPPEIAALAKETFILSPSLTRILSKLEKRSLVTRSPVPHDLRRSTIELTAKGRVLVETIAPQSEAAYGQIEDYLTTPRMRKIMAELEVLSQFDPGDMQQETSNSRGE